MFKQRNTNKIQLHIFEQQNLPSFNIFLGSIRIEFSVIAY